MRARTALFALFAALSLSAQQAEAPEGKVAALAREGHPRPGTETWERHAELLGRPAPRLNLNGWKNGRVTAEDMKGRIVVIHFWNAKHQSSLDAMAHNTETVDKYAGRGVILMGVYGGGDSLSDVAGRMGVAYPVCYSGSGTAEAWRVEYWPTYGVIDRNGILRALGVGRDYVEPIIDALLEEDAAAGKARGAGGAADRGGEVLRLAREGHSRPDTKTWEQHAELLGRPAPALELNSWLNGSVGPEDMKGKIVVIDFWATWRRPCIDAVPRNNATAKEYAGEGVLWVGVCGSDRGEHLMETVAKDAGMAYPVCRPGPGTTDAWRVEYWPTYGVIDRNGILRALGVERDYVEPIIDALLEEGAAAGNAWASGDGGGAQARTAGDYGAQTQRRPAGDESPDNFRFGFRTSTAIIQNPDVLNDFGVPIGFCAFTELMFAKAMGVGFSLEYLTWYPGREMANGARTDASQWKLGADLILRPEGIEKGLFVFAGVGTISANLTASWSVSESGTFTSLGVGYDWRSPSRFGIELRYVAPSFAIGIYNLGNIQLCFRTRS